jgi:hypothetical protein
MATDVELTEGLRTEWNEVGDLRTVTEKAGIKQSITISVLRLADRSTPALTNSEIEQQRSDIEDAVRADPLSEEPITVTVDEIDRDEQTITYAVSTRRVDVTVTTT